MSPDTIPARLLSQSTYRPNEPAYFRKRGGRWQATSWSSYIQQVHRAAKALLAIGFADHDKVSILSGNCPEWSIFCMAAMYCRGVVAGIYVTSSAEEVQHIVHHSESVVVLIDSPAQWDKIVKERENLPRVKRVVIANDRMVIDDPLVLKWEAFLQAGDTVADGELEKRMKSIRVEDPASLIYTSGTTGPPKAVTLTHANLAWTATRLAMLVNATADDHILSYLPLSHVAEQMMSVHTPASVGYTTYYVESLDKIADNLREVQPSIVFGVPRIWEKICAAISQRLDQARGGKKKLLDWVRQVATAVCAQRNRGQPLGLLLSIQYKIADYLLLSKIKKAVGLANARVCVSGAAPISADVLEFFMSLDIIIHEVYGQSETTGPTSFNQPGNTRIGTVGTVISGMAVRIAEDGEVVVKGPNVFAGYYKDERATNEVLVDGWLHSGDVGTLDSSGFLTITGRKKDLIITSGGKNIAPRNIEGALKDAALIGEAVVIGDNKKYLTALLSLDPEEVEKFYADSGAPRVPVEQSTELHKELQAIVDRVNSRLAKVETIKKFAVLPKPLSIENGELTPTLKVKRQVVNARYASLIDGMYTGEQGKDGG